MRSDTFHGISLTDMKAFFTDILKSIGIIAASAVIGLLLLVLVFCLPLDRIQGHVAESIGTLAKEGKIDSVYEGFNSPVDMFTDGIIIEAASYDNGSDSGALDRAIMVYLLDGHDANGWSMSIHDVVVGYYTADTSITYIPMSYPRYWHGYLLYVKPLLSLFDWDTIRLINFAIQVLLVACAINLMAKKNKKGLIAPFILSWLMLIPTVIGRNIQQTDCFVIYVVSIILLLLFIDRIEEKRTANLCFLGMGIAVAYFDFLTYPMVTLVIPLAVYFALRGLDTPLRDILTMIEKAFFWGLGYVGMWGSKWIIASLYTGDNYIMNAIEQILYRTSFTDQSGEVAVSPFAVILTNAWAIWNPFTALALIVTAGLFVYSLVTRQLCGRQILVFFLLSLTPIAWYFLASQHSLQHYFYTSKEFIVTGFAWVCMFMPHLTQNRGSEKA